MAKSTKRSGKVPFDDVFGPDGQPPHLVSWHTSFARGEAMPALSFRDAAMALNKQIRSSRSREVDADSNTSISGANLICATLFLMRHALELGLKKLIARLVALGFTEPPEWAEIRPNIPQNLTKTHNLDDLASIADFAIKRFDCGAPEFAPIQTLCKRWEKADPNGEAFRYATTSNGEPHSTNHLQFTHVRVWHEWLNAMYIIWDGFIWGPIGACEQAKAEGESEYTDER